MDVLAVLETVLTVGLAIYRHAELVKCNKAQSARLAQRVKMVTGSVQSLHERLAAQQNPGQKNVEMQRFGNSLGGLQVTLDDILTLLQKFAKKGWGRRVLFARWHKDAFDDVNDRLEQDIMHLNLGLNVQQVMDRSVDASDRLDDQRGLLANRDEILSDNQEYLESNQRLDMSAEERRDVIAQQMASVQIQLESCAAGESGGQKNVSKKLLVPFCDLRIDEIIAKGEFGTVYLGRWLEQDVAIKRIPGNLTPEQRHEFMREAQIMKSLRSPYIVPIYAVCDEPGRACLVIRHMENGSLCNLMQKLGRPMASVRDGVALDIALGLHYLHSNGIVHRDLKSPNVLIDEHYGAKLSDFGLSRMEAGEQKGVKTIEKQTLDIQWMAPEVAHCSGNRSLRGKEAEMYSYGTILWELLTGKVPFAGLSAVDIYHRLVSYQHETIPADVPQVYQDLLRQCWARRRGDRPTAHDVVTQLRTQVRQGRRPIQNTGVGWSHLPASDQQARNTVVASPAAAPPAVDPEIYFAAAQQFEKDANWTKAVECYLLGRKAGHGRSATNLAMHYLKGTCGVAMNKQTAHSLLLEAAALKHPRGMRCLAFQLDTGDGVPKNQEQATYWYKQAAAMGDSFAQSSLKTRAAQGIR